jgi:hypothetical protein
MRLNIELASLGMEPMFVDVDSQSSVENVIALITVKNNHIDFDKASLFYNGQFLHP